MAIRHAWILSLISLLLPASQARAQCLDYATQVHAVGHASMGYGVNPFDVAVAGNYAYIAVGSAGLRVIDVTDPANPTVVGSVDTPGSARGVTISGTYAYVADGNSGLQVVNVAAPTSPTIVGSLDTPGNALDIVRFFTFAFIADGSEGLRIINVSNPSAPSFTGTLDTQDAQGVAFGGQYVYVADGTAGLKIIDVNSVSSPTLAGTYNTPGTAAGVAVAGNLAYVADGSTLQVVNVQTPGNPIFEGSVATPGDALDLAVAGSVAYVADGTAGLTMVTISDPDTPVVLGSVAVSGDCPGVAVSGTKAYAVDDFPGNMLVVDVPTAAFPSLVGSLPALTFPDGLARSGNHVAVLDLTDFLMVDVSAPATPTVTGQVDIGDILYDVAVSGSIAYVGTGSGVTFVNIANPAAPVVMGENGAGPVRDIALFGSCGCAVGRTITTVQTVCTVPRSLSLPFPPLKGIAVSGDYAFVAADTAGIKVVDLSDPIDTSPSLAGSLTIPGANVTAIAISGSHAYAAGYDETLGARYFLWVVDISNPLAPTLVSSTRFGAGGPFSPLDIALSGNYAYIADAQFGYVVMNIANPAAPVLVGGRDTPGTAQGILAVGDYVVVADYNGGLQIYPGQCGAATGITPAQPQSRAPAAASRLMMFPPAPNPTTGATTLSFRLPGAAAVTLAVFDVGGRRVRSLLEGELAAGDHRIDWDGRNDDGRKVASGTYLARLGAGSEAQTVRMTILR